jgi:glycosyltransferase involved in cell wall biosynthesis
LVVVTNGVDTEELRPLAPASEPYLIFTGTMDFRPNVDAARWFCRNVLPLVRQQTPDTHFYIVGQRPTTEVAALGQQPGVTVTGAVPDVLPYWNRAALCLVPMRMGGGVRLKVLEAMALGRPVVSTAIGCEGIDIIPGHHCAIADDPREFARQIVELLSDRARCQAMAARARELVVERYDWRHLVPRLERFYHELTAGR